MSFFFSLTTILDICVPRLLATYCWHCSSLGRGAIHQAFSSAIDIEHLQASQQDLTEITRKTKHPVGSDAHTAVRAYILQQIRQLGLQAEVQTSFALNPRNSSAAQVHNIVLRLPATGIGKNLATGHQPTDQHCFWWHIMTVLPIAMVLVMMGCRWPICCKSLSNFKSSRHGEMT